MAAPITHIVLAKKVFDRFFKGKDRKEFFIGTCFPDIRYLGVIERRKTHFSQIKLADCMRENSFYAGFKFHSLVDNVRQKFLLKNMKSAKTVEFLKTNKLLFNPILADRALKMTEDEFFYPKIRNWRKYASFLDEISSFQLEFGIDKNMIKKWHKVLQDYFSQKPDDKTRKRFLETLSFSREQIEQINQAVRMVKTSSFGKKLNIGLYRGFENLLE